MDDPVDAEPGCRGPTVLGHFIKGTQAPGNFFGGGAGQDWQGGS